MQRDLIASVAWLKQLPADDQALVLQDINIKAQWAQGDPRSAATYGLSMPGG